MKRILPLAIALAGCGVHISDGVALTAAGDDTGAGGGNDVAPPDAPGLASTPDAPAAAACTSRVVYLAFDGVALKTTNVKSDATTNAAYWTNHNITVPPYHDGGANRDAEIVAITTAVRAGLAPLPITVVTDRPAAGPYVMIAFGGSSTSDFGFDTEYYAINTLDCGDAWPSDVGWVSDIVPDSQLAADNALGAIGYGLGLSGTTDPTTCMCGWNSSCDSADVPCTFGDHTVDDACNTGDSTTQHEVAALDAAFCQ